MEEEEGCDEGGGGGDKQQREAAEAEIEMRDKMFDAYKREMEKYLSLFDEGGDDGARKKAKSAKKRRSDDKKGNKPVIPTVGAIKSKFETLLGADSQQVKSSVQKTSAAVGKLDPAKVLAREGEGSGQADKAKMFVAPVVIDKDAFDRTMKQFEHYRELCNSLNISFWYKSSALSLIKFRGNFEI